MIRLNSLLSVMQFFIIRYISGRGIAMMEKI